MPGQPTYDELLADNHELNTRLRKLKEDYIQVVQERDRVKDLYRSVQLMINNAPDLLWVKDLHKRHLIVNQADCDKLLCCGSPEEAEGKSHSHFAKIQRAKGYEYNFGEQCEDSDEAVKKDPRPQRFFEDGMVGERYLALDVHKAPLYDETGEMVGIVGCGRDITKEVEIQKEKEHIEEQLFQSQKMEAIGVLSGGIAHDFNNILHAVIAHAELLSLDVQEHSSQHQDLLQIIATAERGGELVNQLLLFSRKAKTDKQQVRINREVRNVHKILERTLPKMVIIELQLNSKIWDIHADPVQIEQILLNLASNASHAMPEGGTIRITTKNKVLEQPIEQVDGQITPGKYVQVSVADTGHGMDAATQNKIFEPFFTTKEKGYGTGLGLATVFGIAREHGGGITCQSTTGQGTTMHVYIPSIAQNEKEKKAADADLKPSGKELTILVVEDEPHLMEAMSRMLSSLGHTVLPAAGGEKAIALYKEKSPDLVLMDMDIPGMGGSKCIQQLLEYDPGLKMIITSGHVGAATQEFAEHSFLQKPFRLGDMLKSINNLFE